MDLGPVSQRSGKQKAAGTTGRLLGQRWERWVRGGRSDFVKS